MVAFLRNRALVTPLRKSEMQEAPSPPPMHLSTLDKLGYMISQLENKNTGPFPPRDMPCLLCEPPTDSSVRRTQQPDTLVFHLQKRHAGCITYMPGHIRELIEPYVAQACRLQNVPPERKKKLHQWLDGLPTEPLRLHQYADCQSNSQAVQERSDSHGPITVCISQFSGQVWYESPDRRAYETVASILSRCPQPPQKWPGDKSVNYKLVLGTRTLRDGEIISDLLNEQGERPDCALNLTLCVEALRPPKLCLKNKKLPRLGHSSLLVP